MPPLRSLASSSFAKTLVAITLHRPGLWVLCRVKLSIPVRRRNRIAAFTVALSMIAGAIVAPSDRRLFVVLTVWAVGHVLWGIYLAHEVSKHQSS